MACQNFASTSEGTLAIGKQVACGTVQTQLEELRFTSESLNMTAEYTQSAEIRPGRNISDTIRTATSVGGDINFELSYEVYDDLLQGVLQSAVPLDGAGTEITNGTTKSYFTIERNTPNAAGEDFFTQFQDMEVDGMTLTIAQGAVVGGTFSFMGQGSPVESGTSLDADGYTAAPTFPVFNSLSGVSQILIDGATAGSVESVEFTVSNSMREQRAIGNVAPAGVGNGDFVVTGRASVYFSNASQLSKYTQDTPFSLSVTLDDNTGTTTGNQYTFRFPKCKWTALGRNITGNNEDVIMEGEFQALFDPTLNGTMGIASRDAV